MSIITFIDIRFEILSTSIDWCFDLLVSMQADVVQYPNKCKSVDL